MNSQYIIVYVVFVLLMACVFELVDRVIKAVSNKVKARKVAEAEKSISEEEV